MLKHRLITAAIILPLFILAIWFLPARWFSLLVTIIVAFAAYEWSLLAGIKKLLFRWLYVLLIILSIGLVFELPMMFFFVLTFIVWVWACAAVFCYAKNWTALGFNFQITKLILGFLMLVPFWLAFNVLRTTNLGPMLLLFVFILIWSVDTGAYTVGRLCGRLALIPRVSPNKTWEGVVGGIVLAIVVSFIYGYCRHMPYPQMIKLGVLALVTAIFSVYGDLFESMMKREAGVKDSGRILPGHGGILDRFDSAIVALPIFALGLFVFG